MNSIVLILISLFVPYNVQCTSNWGSNASSNANDKQTISFYGTLTTHQGQAETVDQILIENKHNDIIMYNAPVKHEKANFNEKTKQTEIKLDANTVTNFIKSSIDLSKTSMIKVPEPTTIWVYQKGKRLQRQEFILVEVTAKESTTPQEYLLEYKTKISCNRIDKNSSQKQEVPLGAVDTLTIEGYSLTVLTNKKNIKKETPTTCPIVNTETETTTEIRVK